MAVFCCQPSVNLVIDDEILELATPDDAPAFLCFTAAFVVRLAEL